MKFLEDKAAKLKIGWNTRPLTEHDFYKLCRRLRVKVTEMPLTTGGFYYRVKHQDFIAIDSKLTGSERLIVLFHELGHFLFHAPESGATANFHNVGKKTRVEREADAFALCSIIPLTRLLKCTPEELIADDGISPEHLAERIALYETHGI